MAIQDINIGTVPNDGTGDTLRDGGIKINNNNLEFTQQIDLNDSAITTLANSKVDSVTGSAVDNADPLNPIINVREYKSAQASLSRTNQTTIPLANTQANVFEEYFEDSFTPTTTDNFTVSCRWKWSSDVTQSSAFFRVTFSDGINPDIVLLTVVEPKDSSGTGEVVNVLTGGVITGNVNTGTAERLNGFEVADAVLTQGVTYNIKLEWANETGNADLTIYSSTIRFEQNTITQ